MRRLGSENVVYFFSSDNKPAYHVEDREEVLVETLDAFSGQVKSATDLFEKVDMAKVNPATGPVEVVGMLSGETLCVSIESIRLGSKGVLMCSPELGILGRDVRRSRSRIVSLRGAKVVFSDSLEIDINPHVGVIGVSPRKGKLPTFYPGDFGGNMDAAEAGPGSKVYLPTYVDGAMVSLGDVHAAMGDGEVCGTGVEVAAEVTARFSKAADMSIERPMIESRDAWVAYAAAKTLDEAARLATQDLVRFISNACGMDFEDAYMLASVAADLGISQVADPLVAAKMTIPKKYL